MSGGDPRAGCPYRGLAPYRAADAPLFFGRSRLAGELIRRLAGSGVLVISGPSGAGKTSLVHAGLLAPLEQGALPGSRDWGCSVLAPGVHPLDSLWAGLGELAGSALPDIYSLEEAPAAAARRLIKPGVVVVDRLEELFTLCPDRSEREAFCGLLGALSGGEGSPLQVVLCVDSASHGACAGHPWLVSAINRNLVLVPPIAGTGLREVVEGPARAAGLQLAEGLWEAIVADAGRVPDVLPQLSHALYETWRRREGDRLTLDGYREVGGVAGAIDRTAERAWAGLDAGQRQAARPLLLALARPRDGILGAGEPAREIGDAGPLREAVTALAAAGLLVANGGGVELAHHTLTRHWRRLAGWLEERREEDRTHRRLQRAAREWEGTGRPRQLLLSGLPLANALEWRGQAPGDLGEPLESFLSAGEEVREVVLRAEAARKERERQAHRRTVTRWRVLAAALAVALVVALTALARGAAGAPRAGAGPQLHPADADPPAISTHRVRVLI